MAWAGLADTYALHGFFGAGSPRETAPRGKEAALTALQIDDTLAEAHSALGTIKVAYDWDWPGAQREFKRAIELNPNDGTSHQRYATYFLAMGRVDDAIAEFTRAQKLEPLSLIISSLVGRGFYHARQYDRAIGELEKSLEMDPNFARAYLFLAWAYEQKSALVYVGLGAKNLTFEWLDKAYEDHSTWLTWIKVDPRFDGIRDDPRYHDLLQRMRLPE